VRAIVCSAAQISRLQLSLQRPPAFSFLGGRLRR
jgi:hypothetical protein